MKRSLGVLVDVLGVVAILVFFVCILGLVILFATRPALFWNTKNAVTFILEIGGTGGLAGYILRRHIIQSRSIGGGLIRLLRREPLIHGLIWIFIVVEVMVFTYVLPLHFVVAEIKQPVAGLPAGSSYQVEASTAGGVHQLGRVAGVERGFRSPRILRWGERCNVRVKSEHVELVSVPVAWQPFAFVDVIRGVKVPIDLRPDRVRVTIEGVSPQKAEVSFVSEGIDTTFKGPAVLSLIKASPVTITVSAGGSYEPQRVEFLASSDTVLSFDLATRPAQAVFRAESEGRVEERGMFVYVDGQRQDGLSGGPVTLSAGTHEVSLEKDMGDGTWAVVTPFPFTIGAGAYKETTLTYSLVRR